MTTLDDLGSRGRQLLPDGQEISALFLTEHMREDEVKPVFNGTVICHWCGVVFAPTDHNYVHLGGWGDIVPGCDKCLWLKE